ncbi:N-acetyltransferase ESCO1-like [Nilaparvata lugens]|uniref:N-acetyltransferase ESCO1-like n=1 Tax=Nilaparvata lugens TaxID=108931 RepID=UPI00193DFA94|nr:N-acetyltransferase ESCO1-like [Nilaparvata lugens]
MSSTSSKKTQILRRSPYSREGDQEWLKTRIRATKLHSKEESSAKSAETSNLKTSLSTGKNPDVSSEKSQILRRSPYSRGDDQALHKTCMRATKSNSNEKSATIAEPSSSKTLLSTGKDPDVSLEKSQILRRSPYSRGGDQALHKTRMRAIKSNSKEKLAASAEPSSSKTSLSTEKYFDIPTPSDSELSSTLSDKFPSSPTIEPSENNASTRSRDRVPLQNVTNPERVGKWFVSGLKTHERRDLTRVLKYSIFKKTEEIRYHRPEEKFYKIEETREILKQRQLDRQEDEKIDHEMKVEAKRIQHKRFFKSSDIPAHQYSCECEFPHPDYWSDQMIAEVHRNFYKIKYDLKIPKEMDLFHNSEATLIKLKMNERNAWTKKARQAIEFIDIELGCSGITTRHSPDSQVYMMLQNNTIIGCAVANEAHQGFRLVSKLEDQPLVSPHPEPIECGVSGIWVIPKYRRHKIASFLLEYVRRYFKSEILNKESIGFSDPSALGRLLIASYMGKSDFKIYFPEYMGYVEKEI